MPTYKEAVNLRELLPRILQVAKEVSTHELHLVIVDYNSPDVTGDLASSLAQQDPRIHVSKGEKMGLGEAYKRGIAFAMANLDPELIISDGCGSTT